MYKKVGEYTHTICDECSYDITENWDRDFQFRNQTICFNCFAEKRKELNTPYYQNHIPDFVDGGTYKIFEFTKESELLEHLKERKRKDHIFVQGDRYIIIQNIKEKYWWVLGTVNNFKMTIPKINYYIYNENNDVDQNKLKAWLGEDFNYGN